MARNAASARSAASARTAPTYPRNPMGAVYIKGARSIEASTGDTARTTDGWIEDRKYGWATYNIATTCSYEFDTAVTRTGVKTLKVSTTNTTGRAQAYSSDTTVAGFKEQGLILKPSTQYTLNCWVKTNNVTTNGACLRIVQFDSAGVIGTPNTDTNRLSGTNDWTLCTKTFTSDADAYYAYLALNTNVAGNVSDSWFDVNSMTLIETGITRGAVA